MDAGVTFAIGLGVTLLLTFFTILSTGSLLAVGVLWVLLSMGMYLLYTYGVVTADILTSEPIAQPVTQPVGQAASSLTNVMLGSEVFHVADNQFTYNDAQAVCAAYDSQLATLEQIIEAYNHGAEWCGYGWSAGGMALYPTQKGTWDALQQESDQTKRTACGRPGVNGGYFDPNSKFGVNCYGIKPQGNMKLPAPLPGTDPNAFSEAVTKFKAMVKSFNLDPYSRSVWSGSPVSPVTNTVSAGQRFVNQVTENFSMREHFPAMEALPGQTTATTGLPLGSPYGLRGDRGDVGEMGPTGPQGPTGMRGSDGVSNLAGPTGPQGVQGHAGERGEQGLVGEKGDKGDRGDRGPQGADGAAAAAGATGPAGKDGINGKDGAAGAKGDKGDRGDFFKPPRNGLVQAYDDGANYGTLFKGDANKQGGWIGMMFRASDNKPWIWMRGPNNSWNGTFDENNADRW